MKACCERAAVAAAWAACAVASVAAVAVWEVLEVAPEPLELEPDEAPRMVSRASPAEVSKAVAATKNIKNRPRLRRSWCFSLKISHSATQDMPPQALVARVSAEF